jgi:hypothetical protein
MFLINPVFETVIHLAFHSFKHDFTLNSNSLSKQSKASQSIEYNFLFLSNKKSRLFLPCLANRISDGADQQMSGSD